MIDEKTERDRCVKERLEGLRRSNNGWGAEALDIALWLLSQETLVRAAVADQSVDFDDYDQAKVLDAVAAIVAFRREHPRPGTLVVE